MYMKHNIDKVLYRIEEEFSGHISRNARYYVEVNIGQKADSMGIYDLKKNMTIPTLSYR